jgi:hypothetical protein
MKSRRKPKVPKLVYSAYARCQCGAGLAYRANIGIHGYWDCSDILLGIAPAMGDECSVRHDDTYPFVFWEIKSESKERGTTRTLGKNGESE